MYHSFIANNNNLHLHSASPLTECFCNTLLKYPWLKGGSGKIKAPDMTPGRGVSYILPLKVFFYAMPFPARQQGGLTGNYVSLPGYTETKQRVRQDHPPLTPLPLSCPSSYPTPPRGNLFSVSVSLFLFCCINSFVLWF